MTASTKSTSQQTVRKLRYSTQTLAVTILAMRGVETEAVLAMSLLMASASFAGDAACGCDPQRCHACAIYKSSGASPRNARLAPPRPRRLPGSPLAPWASSLLGCEDGSACSFSVPNVPQNRSCHEQGRAPRGNVIIRDGTPRSDNTRQ